MILQQGLESLKRQSPPSSCQSLQDHPDRGPSKKQKLHHPTFPPREFWERLSKIPLTRNALRALDKQKLQVPQATSPSRPVPSCRRQSRARQPTRGDPSQPVRQISSPTSSKRIKAFARRGGPDLSHLRGYPEPSQADAMSSVQSSLGRRKRGSQSTSQRDSGSTTTSATKKKTKTTGPYDRAFQQHLIDHHIFPHDYEFPDGEVPQDPDNMDEIRHVLSRPRASLSPSRFTTDDFRKFVRADNLASREGRVLSTVMPTVEGTISDPKCVSGDVMFTNLEHLTDGTLATCKPDLYYGARPEQLDRKIRKELGSYIVPSTQHDLPIVPNFFVEAKGPDGSLNVANRQLSYDLAIGARGFAALQARSNTRPAEGIQASALGCSYYGGTLKIYTGHQVSPSAPGKEPSYVTKQIKAVAISGDVESFRQGVAAYRNARDWAKQQRDEVIRQANDALSRDVPVSPVNGLGPSFATGSLPDDHASTRQRRTANRGSIAHASYESDTSADELSPDYQPRVKRAKAP